MKISQMQSKHFLGLVFILWLMLVFGYFFAVDKMAIPNNYVGLSYKDFLLKASVGLPPRIIIDSGSNSHHGIHSEMVEEYFGRLTITIADNGDYPLRHKISRLRNSTQEGDVIILPLEWLHYSRGDKLPKRYVESVMDRIGSSSFYYRALSTIEQFEFVLRDLPFRLGIERITEFNANPTFNVGLIGLEKDSLATFRRKIIDGERGNKSERNVDELHSLTSGLACDHFLFGLFDVKLSVSDRFREDLKSLRQLASDNKLTVLFAWPVVVARDGNECYTHWGERLNSHFEGVRDAIESNGFQVLGDVQEAKYESNCMLDTYYHITPHCAVKHTRKMIAYLERYGMERNRKYDKEESRKHLLSAWDDVKLEKLVPLRKGVEISGVGLNKSVVLGGGWSALGLRGSWSLGKYSELRVKLGGGYSGLGIRIRGDYYNGVEETKVFINGEFVGRFNLSDIRIPLKHERFGQRTDSIMYVRFEYVTPILSPKQLGNSADDRKIKFGLRSIELTE